jgi:chromosome partitioning protein
MHSADNGQVSTIGWSLKIPPTTDVLVVDTPAGLRPHQLSEFLRRCDTVLVPIVPSGIDTRATTAFLSELAQATSVRSGGVRVGVVANRVKARTLAARALPEVLSDLPFTLTASLRDTQAYVLAGAMGKGVFDFHGATIASCQADWGALLDWVTPPQHTAAATPAGADLATERPAATDAVPAPTTRAADADTAFVFAPNAVRPAPYSGR